MQSEQFYPNCFSFAAEEAQVAMFLKQLGIKYSKLIKDEFYLWVQHPALTVSIGIADQTNEQEAKKQGAEEIISAILIGDDAEICALLFTGQLQVDLIVGGDIPHLLGLQNCQLASEADDNTRANGFARLPEDCVGRRCR
mgnify:FL=1